MLSEHPHIKNIHVSEVFFKTAYAGYWLLIQTWKCLPPVELKENSKLLDLHNYLEQIALHDFGDFDEVEIRTLGVHAEKNIN